MIYQFGPAGQDAQERQLLLRSEGPIIGVVAKPSDNLAGLKAKRLIDTGASVNCIDNHTARRLNLNVIDYKNFQSASEQKLTPVYIGRLNIPRLKTSIFGQFYGADLLGVNKVYHYLLGRPFLSNFIFSYDGPDGTFQLAKPSNALTPQSFDE